MDYNVFANWISEEMEAALEPKFGPLRITPVEVEKLDGQSYKGISVGRLSDNISVSISLEDLFTQYENGRKYTSILEELCSSLTEKLGQIPTLDSSLLKSYDRLKDHLTLELVGTEKNRDLLEKLPHKMIEDMAVVYRCDLGENANGSVSALITDQLLESFGISPEQLHSDALRSAPAVMPLSLKPLFQVLMEMSPGSMVPPPPFGPTLYVATNESQVNGASVIAYPEFLEKAAACVGDQYFILPSSKHEVLLLEDDGSASVAELKAMVRTINEVEVKPQDVLTDNVYHYDGVEKIFETADSFEARTKASLALERPSVLQDLKDNCLAVSEKPTPGHKPPHQDTVL